MNVDNYLEILPLQFNIYINPVLLAQHVYKKFKHNELKMFINMQIYFKNNILYQYDILDDIKNML